MTCADYVTLTDGTGVVHIAPAFGEDDAQVGRRYDLPFLQLVDEKGEMTEETPVSYTHLERDRGRCLHCCTEERGISRCKSGDCPGR